jgi:uncharacterized protein (TIGR04255 family)
MSLDFLICREKHAIAEFQAVVRFIQPIDPTSFGDVSSVVSAVAQELNLPARVPIPSLSFEIEQEGGARFSPPPVNPVAIGYQRFAANGEIEERISADPASVTYVSRNYLGWERTRDVLTNTISKIAVQYAKRALPVATVLLQYNNEFSSEKAGFVAVQDVFRRDTRWVPPIFSELDDLWHSHVGMFLSGEGFKNLVNVNVDVVFATTPARPEEFTNIKLLIIAARQYNVSGGKPLVMSASDTPKLLLESFDAAHDLEKAVFFETLSEEYLEAVNAR